MKYPPLTEAFLMRDMIHPSRRRHCWWNGNGRHFFAHPERRHRMNQKVQMEMAIKIRASRIRE